MAVRVLLVEDDDGVADALVEVLDAHGHVPTRVRRGADALTRHRDADLVLLDLGLPDEDGLEILRKLRRVATVPVLVLTARGDERSVVRGLRLGADDYLVKPVRLAELLARMEAVARRAGRAHGGGETVVRLGDVEIDLLARRVRVAGDEVVLTPKEFDVLAVLAGRPGRAVSRQQLMDQVWGDAYLAVSRSLDVHVAQLRNKLGRPRLLTTIRGFGYRLGEPEPPGA
ncbi:DNA-binding response regulator, OmpR family, contains REC and winged-helix (wHTH) domain [Streptoalloteichus tenebrarius]|uniref:DNA-binding response regulator, OmpR family, contains REC and winged-helix (WHTH) domain n=1 Tax=Streptoalloteichus tenebrarius (strain ATCC 17920 / DSM 40477 / JCM 4838 / CBS 697.72 / NBRC 16177 / NCIMB 11028 / NRRL B-12390 / A12253. 1 / ISP 5477) TaxID=1933 RepID=A0ABT1HQW1_STRSD|nr:response regulator transcription factor [Streptoalloteichus tenebrarius]MCP2257910.1 DNA-binding response regulator, OmpR family, contains REC and winged-helix (wHTH) domain [Streptoalloteichus tenebrarius]BFE99725.1 response regulator transcription factor [Streptoalloteichus tenebrarius]